MTGCQQTETPENPKTKPPGPAALQLVVVDDPPLAEAIGKLKAEWQARTGGSLKVRETNLADFVAQPMPSGDAVIYPAGLLGTLVERDVLVRVPERLLAADELAWSEVFPAVQTRSTWGGAVYALPLGSPVFVCLYRAELFERLGRQPPTTWAEYWELADFFGDRARVGDAAGPADAPWSGTLEPLAPPWSGRTLLARAAAYAKHRDQYSTLFDIETMAPRVAGPPFVRALEELVAASGHASNKPTVLNPHEVRQAFLAGHSAMALTWLSGAGGTSVGGVPWPIGVAVLPGGHEVYNFPSARWEVRGADESAQVPMLSVAGRLGSVVQTSPRIDAAFELLVWLSGPQWSARLAAVSPAATLFRRSHMSNPGPWVDAGIAAQTARQYAEVVEKSLAGGPTLALDIPGEAQYWAALDEAVQSALSGEKPAAAALEWAAARWRAITERLGNAAQRRAYRRSLGLDS